MNERGRVCQFRLKGQNGGRTMLKCYGEFLENGKKFEYSLIVESMSEADKVFVKKAQMNGWVYLGIVRFDEA